jgi:RAD51-like protein 2
MVANQMATKILNAENKPANFDTGDKAVMMPQLGEWGCIYAWTTTD